MNRNIRIYLSDMLENMNLAEQFVENVSYDAFSKDRKTVYAVLRCIEIIGEAAKNIPAELRREHSEIPWKEMSGMRDKVIHFYFGLDMRKIWLVLKEDIPRIKPLIKSILENL